MAGGWGKGARGGEKGEGYKQVGTSERTGTSKRLKQDVAEDSAGIATDKAWPRTRTRTRQRFLLLSCHSSLSRIGWGGRFVPSPFLSTS